MTTDIIRDAVINIVKDFPIQKVSLFGSRATGTNREDSDIDLLVEFSAPISLLTLSSIKYRLEDALGLSVDVIHAPLREHDIIEIEKEIVLYAA